jgi:hypothetical protein
LCKRITKRVTEKSILTLIFGLQYIRQQKSIPSSTSLPRTLPCTSYYISFTTLGQSPRETCTQHTSPLSATSTSFTYHHYQPTLFSRNSVLPKLFQPAQRHNPCLPLLIFPLPATQMTVQFVPQHEPLRINLFPARMRGKVDYRCTRYRLDQLNRSHYEEY